MRLDYPAYLGQTFSNLEWYGREMRLMHGPGTKRIIRFDDQERSLYIDVKLPGEEYWHKVDAEMAKDFKADKDKSRRKITKQTLQTASGSNPSLSDGGQDHWATLNGLLANLRGGEELAGQRVTT